MHFPVNIRVTPAFLSVKGRNCGTKENDVDLFSRWLKVLIFVYSYRERKEGKNECLWNHQYNTDENRGCDDAM